MPANALSFLLCCVFAFQVAYSGLLQIFLTPRAVFLVVCDAGAFMQRDSNQGDQMDNDIFKLEELRVFDWLRWISWRVPDSAVLLVATKCDLVAEMAAEVARRIEAACREWLKSWFSSGMTTVRMEDGVFLTSCNVAARDGETWPCDWRDDTYDKAPPSVLDSVLYRSGGAGLRTTSMVLPRSWNMALTFLDALEGGRQVSLWGLTQVDSKCLRLYTF